MSFGEGSNGDADSHEGGGRGQEMCCCCFLLHKRLPSLARSNELLACFGVSLRELGRGIEVFGWDGRYVSQQEQTNSRFKDLRDFWESWFRYVSFVLEEVAKKKIFIETYQGSSAEKKRELLLCLRDYLFGADYKRIEVLFDDMPDRIGCWHSQEWREDLTSVLQDPLGQSMFGAVIVAKVRSIDPSFDQCWKEVCEH